MNDPRPADSRGGSTNEPEWFGDPDAAVAPGDGLPDCDYCGNKRFVVDRDGQLRPCSQCGVAQRWRAQAVAAFSSRNRYTETQTFLNFRTDVDGKESAVLRQCLRTAEKFAEAPDGKWLVIWGERGNGKSHLCAAVDNHLRQAGVAVIFVTAPDLFAALRRSMDHDRTTEQESYSGRMRTFKEVPVLILDDLGAETSSAWSDGVLFELLDYRYRNRLPTMIASNVPPEHFDPRLASRMQDRAFSAVLTNTAPDFRLRTDRKRNG